MDIIPFIQFTFTSQFIARWLSGGILLYIPVLNFFSLGYLSKASRLLMVGSVGLPVWDDKIDIWIQGIKLLCIFIFYEAVPFFLFSCGFFFTNLGTVPAFFGYLMMKCSILALLLFSFFIPFAFAAFSEKMDFRRALEFERVYRGIKEVFIPYLGGYLGVLIASYICTLIIRIPYLIGFILSSLLTFYVFLLATFYFTMLFRRTSLSSERIFGVMEGEEVSS
jgi:hypothetical protein